MGALSPAREPCLVCLECVDAHAQVLTTETIVAGTLWCGGGLLRALVGLLIVPATAYARMYLFFVAHLYVHPP